EVGGMQGLIEPWARAIRTRGGEIALGWKPVEIVVDGGCVRGVVAVDRTNLVREVRAPVAISTYPVWENFDLIDERLFPPDLVACLEWSAYQYVTAPQSMSWAWAPVVRHGLEVPGIDGLYLASSTLEAPAAVLDIGAYAGREAARRALARR